LSEELRACIHADATLTFQLDTAKRDLDTAKRDLQTAESTLKVTQYNLSTAQADLKNAKAARDKIVSVVTLYLNDIIATLKDPTNFYIVLRKRAKGVFDAVVGTQSQ
jgi:multidrug resistance efflux pump